MATPEAQTSPPVEGASQHRIVFTPSGLHGDVADGTTVLDAARQIGVDLDSVCGGRGICGRCQVVPQLGSFPKWGVTVQDEHLSDPDLLEAHYRGKRPLSDGRRLGCALKIEGDAVIDVPAASQIHRQVVRKDVDLGDLVVDPMIVLRYVTPRWRGDDDPRSAWQRIREELADAFGLDDVDASFEVLGRLHEAVAHAAVGLTVAVRDGEAIAVWPGFVDRIAGVAIDIGSTTIAGHLCDLSTGEVLATSGRMNPQIRFGEDLMSRVSYVMMHPDGDAALTTAVREALDELVGELTFDAGLDRDRVLDVVLVGNPIMHHLALGIDPTPLGQSPFTLATSDAVEARARDLELDLPGARVYTAPCIAGHVGADTAAVILAEGPHRSDELTLLIDVGTNAEIVLGDRRGLYAASSPTGPAFEGAQISAGQRATTGAIERVRIDRDTLEPRFTVIGSELWSDDPGFPTASALTGVTGICGSGIVEVIAELFLAGVIDTQGVIRPEAADRSERVVADERTYSYVLHRGPTEIRVTQADVRAIQLAKAALRAGTDLLLEHAGVETPERIKLAGAFGAHIDPLHAMVLGLIPDAPLGQVSAVGNAAGSGAVRALVSRAQRREVERLAREVTKIETATEPRFQELFVAALAFPHVHAPNPHLAEVVDLPAATVRSSRERPGRRRRGDRGATALSAVPTDPAGPSAPGPSAAGPSTPGPSDGPPTTEQELAP